MREPISGHFAVVADRKPRYRLVLVIALALGLGAEANAGVIRQKAPSTPDRLQIAKANPWSGYWVRALSQHKLKLDGPKINRVFAFDADRSLPLSPFVRYMQWREGLNPKQFATFHADLVRMLRRVKIPATPTTPGTVVPPSTGVPIEPPDFSPITPAFVNPPPETPEPTTMAFACVIAAGVLLRRRLGKTPRDLAGRA